MTQEDIERLINDKRIVSEMFDDAQVAGFWSKAVAAFADARVHGISTDTALQTAYRSCLQATLGVLATKGLRVKSNAGRYRALSSGLPAIRAWMVRTRPSIEAFLEMPRG